MKNSLVPVHSHSEVNDNGELVGTEIPAPHADSHAPAGSDPITAISLPTGIYFPYGGAAAPTGFLLCDGSAVSRTTYAALFAVIGTSYGVGDNSTTFNIPDLRGRTVFGYKSTDSAFNAIGKTGGAKVVNSEHNHAVDPPNTKSGNNSATENPLTGDGGAAALADSPHTHDVNIASFTSGNGGATNLAVLNPYEVGNWIIKY